MIGTMCRECSGVPNSAVPGTKCKRYVHNLCTTSLVFQEVKTITVSLSGIGLMISLYVWRDIIIARTHSGCGTKDFAT
jgi:hypothetical protein